MNLFNVIEEIEKVDPEFNERVSPRRDAIKNITSFGSKVAIAALPFALGTMFKKAYGAAPATSPVDVLNFALTLEFLESTFYGTAIGAPGLVPAADLPYITTIAHDEAHHVTFLQAAITAAGGTPVTAPQFDLTGGNNKGNGPFKDVLTNYQTFLAVAQTFEDTGVRAYKGQAKNLLGTAALTAALSIHAVEARHASAVRYLRATKYNANIKPWINSTASASNDTGIALVDANYAGENNVMQGPVDVSKLPGATSGSTIGVTAAAAAFDEPLDMAAVLALLQGSFIVTA